MLSPHHVNSSVDLNRALNEFLEKHAVKESASEWFDKHPFLEAIRREMNEEDWMGK